MIIVALGANLPSDFGEPYETLEKAKDSLEDYGLKIIARSKTYLTAPVPISDDPWYHNSVVGVETDKNPYELLGLLQEIENTFGRVRTVRNAPRVLDLDLVAYHDEIVDRPELIVPHPRMSERAFVLFPVRDVCSDWGHPVSGRSVDDLIADLPADQEFKVIE